MPAPSSASGAGWREVPPRAQPPPAVTLRAPRAVYRGVVVPELGDAAWDQAAAAAERAFRCAGVLGGAGDNREWAAALARGRARLWTTGVAGGVRVEAEHVRPRPRPWGAAAAWLCLPAAAVAAAVLAGRPARLDDWSVVAALLAAPAVVAVWAGVAEWARSLTALRRVRYVLGVAERAAWQAQARWVEAYEAAPENAESDVLPVEPPGLGPSEWLAAEELDGLGGARPTRVELPPRHARRVVARATAEPRAPAPEGFAEWQPTAPTWPS